MMKTSKQICRMPKNYRCTLNAFRRKLHGLIPKELDDFDPSIILGKIEHGEKVLILDSNKDLPENWKDIQLSEYLPDNPGEDCVEENINPSDAGISEDSLSSDGAELPPLSGYQYFKMKDLMQSHFHSHVSEPGPVLCLRHQNWEHLGFQDQGQLDQRQGAQEG